MGSDGLESIDGLHCLPHNKSDYHLCSDRSLTRTTTEHTSTNHPSSPRLTTVHILVKHRVHTHSTLPRCDDRVSILARLSRSSQPLTCLAGSRQYFTCYGQPIMAPLPFCQLLSDPPITTPRHNSDMNCTCMTTPSYI